jgi:hypothetical protein
MPVVERMFRLETEKNVHALTACRIILIGYRDSAISALEHQSC